MVLGIYRQIGLLVFLFSILTLGGQPRFGLPSKQPSSWQPPHLDRIESNWVHASDRRLEIPFQLGDLEEAPLSCVFSVPENLPDTVFMVFEGVVGKAAVRLNDRFLQVVDRPFERWSISLPCEWFHPGETDTLFLVLDDWRPRPGYPRTTLGLLNPIWLMDREQHDFYMHPVMSEARGIRRVAIVPPVFGDQGFFYDQKYAAELMLPLLKEEIAAIYFPFAPPYEMLRLARVLGLKRVSRLEEDMEVAIIQEWTQRLPLLPFQQEGWLTDGHPTPNYGNWYTLNENRPERLHPGVFGSLVLLLPFLLLGFVKLAAPGFYPAQAALLFKPRFYLDSLGNAGTSQSGFLLILTFVKILLLTTGWSFLLFFISENNLWHLIDLGSPGSLLETVFGHVDSLWGIWYRFLVGGILLLIFQILVSRILGAIYRMRGFTQAVLNLEIVSAYPLVWTLPVAFGLILVAKDSFALVFMVAAVVLAVTYLIRRVYLVRLGLNRWLNFSPGVEFLYICTFNLAPYIIWF